MIHDRTFGKDVIEYIVCYTIRKLTQHASQIAINMSAQINDARSFKCDPMLCMCFNLSNQINYLANDED